MKIFTTDRSTAFGSFNLNKLAQARVDVLPLAEKLQVAKWQTELSNTKYFDLLQESTQYSDTYFFVNKSNGRGIEGPLGRAQLFDKEVSVCGRDGIDPGDWVSFVLEFENKARAKNAYNVFARKNKESNLFNKITNAVNAIKVIEESLDFMSAKTQKTSWLKRIMAKFNA